MKIAKASILASLVYLVFPAAFIALGWFDLRGPAGENIDSGEIETFLLFLCAAVSASISVFVAFPATAIALSSSFSTKKWLSINIAIVIAVSYIASCVYWFYTAEHSLISVLTSAFFLTVIFSSASTFFLIPALLTWLVFARLPEPPVSGM